MSEVVTFDAKIAKAVGVHAAIVYQRLKELSRRSIDGWVKITVKKMEEVEMPYFTAKQVRLALNKLVQSGLVEKEKFPADQFDRSNSYRVVSD